jgi:hypothetical protein
MRVKRLQKYHKTQVSIEEELPGGGNLAQAVRCSKEVICPYSENMVTDDIGLQISESGVDRIYARGQERSTERADDETQPDQRIDFRHATAPPGELIETLRRSSQNCGD